MKLVSKAVAVSAGALFGIVAASNIVLAAVADDSDPYLINQPAIEEPILRVAIIDEDQFPEGAFPKPWPDFRDEQQAWRPEEENPLFPDPDRDERLIHRACAIIDKDKIREECYFDIWPEELAYSDPEETDPMQIDPLDPKSLAPIVVADLELYLEVESKSDNSGKTENSVKGGVKYTFD